MSGACVRRARLHAALGSPMPTKHTARSQQQPRGGHGHHFVAGRVGSCSPTRRLREELRHGRGCRARDAASRSLEALALARDPSQALIEAIVARVVAVRRRSGCAPPGNHTHGADHPVRQHDAHSSARRARRPTSSTVTSSAARRQRRFARRADDPRISDVALRGRPPARAGS